MVNASDQKRSSSNYGVAPASGLQESKARKRSCTRKPTLASFGSVRSRARTDHFLLFPTHMRPRTRTTVIALSPIHLTPKACAARFGAQIDRATPLLAHPCL